jgi:hypothetical protein
MSFFVQLLKAIAVLVPDFLTLGLGALGFFNLYCIAESLHVAGTLGTDSALGVSFALAYLVAIAINFVGSLLTPARSRRTALAQSKSSVKQVGRDPLQGTLRGQPVKHRGALIES